jgi:hypothetical protein
MSLTRRFLKRRFQELEVVDLRDDEVEVVDIPKKEVEIVDISDSDDDDETAVSQYEDSEFEFPMNFCRSCAFWYMRSENEWSNDHPGEGKCNSCNIRFKKNVDEEEEKLTAAIEALEKAKAELRRSRYNYSDKDRFFTAYHAKKH